MGVHAERLLEELRQKGKRAPRSAAAVSAGHSSSSFPAATSLLGAAQHGPAAAAPAAAPAAACAPTRADSEVLWRGQPGQQACTCLALVAAHVDTDSAAEDAGSASGGVNTDAESRAPLATGAILTGHEDGRFRCMVLGPAVHDPRPESHVAAVLEVQAHDSAVKCIVSLGGGLVGGVATAGGDGAVALWRRQGSGARVAFLRVPAVAQRHSAAVRALVFEPQSRTLFSGGADSSVRCLAVSTGETRVLTSRLQGQVTALACDAQPAYPNLSWALYVGLDTGALLSVDADTGRPLKRFTGHAKLVGCLSLFTAPRGPAGDKAAPSAPAAARAASHAG